MLNDDDDDNNNDNDNIYGILGNYYRWTQFAAFLQFEVKQQISYQSPSLSSTNVNN